LTILKGLIYNDLRQNVPEPVWQVQQKNVKNMDKWAKEPKSHRKDPMSSQKEAITQRVDALPVDLKPLRNALMKETF